MKKNIFLHYLTWILYGNMLLTLNGGFYNFYIYKESSCLKTLFSTSTCYSSLTFTVINLNYLVLGYEEAMLPGRERTLSLLSSSYSIEAIGGPLTGIPACPNTKGFKAA